MNKTMNLPDVSVLRKMFFHLRDCELYLLCRLTKQTSSLEVVAQGELDFFDLLYCG